MTDYNFVPRYYQMDPETEDMLPNGGAIRNGMVVLIAEANKRAIVKETPLDWELDRVLERNRWAKVSHVIGDGTTVVFIATYEDGTKKQRLEASRSAWLVKKDSMPDEEKNSDIQAKVFLVVKSLINEIKQDMTNTEDKFPSTWRYADDTAKSIMELFEGEK